MGNCCQNQKKPNLPESSASASVSHKPDPQPRYLKFKSKYQNFSYKLEYHSRKPLSSYLNHIILNNPELVIDDIQVLNKNQEIVDFQLSLRELDIVPSETLYIEPFPIVGKKNCVASVSVSEEEIAEEESTTKFQVAGISAKLGMGRVKTESTGDAASLWRSAMSSPKNHYKKVLKDADASSLINPMDLTIENKVPMKFVPYDVKNGQSVLLDSDDSYLKNDGKARDSMHRHPYDFFKDLQGPFSVLKQL